MRDGVQESYAEANGIKQIACPQNFIHNYGVRFQNPDRDIRGVDEGCHVGRRCKLARCCSVCEATKLVMSGVTIDTERLKPGHESKVVARSSVSIFQLMSVRNGGPWNLD